MKRGGTRLIDREIVRLSGKRRPALLFFPTASSDSKQYWDVAQPVYGKLGCKMDVLFLIRDRPSPDTIARKIRAADIIYVGGGNTLKMMRLWRRLGVDKLLKKAHRKGAVLCGISAGSICWFEGGHSDSMSFYHPKKWKYIRVKGLGLLKGTHCPHHNSQTLRRKRRDDFAKMMAKRSDMGIALEDRSALVVQNGKFRIITSKKGARAFRVYRKRGNVVTEEIAQMKEWRAVRELYAKEVMTE